MAVLPFPHDTAALDVLFGRWAASSPIGLYLVQDGVFAWVNPQFEHDTGFRAAELIGRPSLDLVHPEDRAQVRASAVAMLKGERRAPYEYRCITKSGGVRVILESVAAAPAELGRATLGNFMDITARTEAEAARRRSEAQAVRSLETAQLLRVQLEVLTQADLAGVVAAVSAAGERLGVPCHVACLLWDPGLDAWHLTTLLDRAGRPVDLTTLGVSVGPFPFQIPPDAAPRPVTELLGAAWGPVGCAQVEQRLGCTAALCMPIFGPQGPQGVLIAFLPYEGPAALFAGVLAHAATAAARFLGAGAAQQGAALDPRSFAERAAHEIVRAARYNRPLAIVVLTADRLEQLTPLGERLARTLRAWDLLGRWNASRPVLAVALPETDRIGGRGLIERLGRDVGVLTAGAAAYPDDGTNLEQLVERALGRVARTVPAGSGGAAGGGAPGAVWQRGAPAGPGSDTVRCPVCLTAYTHRGAAGLDGAAAAAARAAAQAALHGQCPRHPDRLVVS